MAADFLWQLEAVSFAPARLREVTVEIRRGVTAVLGWSGAGKTSLLNLLVAFEKPSAGQLRGAPRVAWVPQNGGLWPHCTAREHLEITRCSPEKVAKLLREFDLTERAHARPDELSEGERSRLAVARALGAGGEVFVMDEPLAHVDPARVGKYWRVIRDHVANTGASLIFSTHEPAAALGEARDAICLREGRVLHTGPLVELYANPPTAELMDFLGPGNWFTAEEARQWLGVEFPTARCLRPEQLRIEPAERGRFIVESARFRGAFAEVEIAGRSFFHRPARAELREGMSVNLGVCS